ncbi:MAG: quinolinate synthase NadA [Candidatus Aminicenantes bacterium]|nr:quinolinate synthase NadA [Candidatus Aminicenantes bacterium]
MSGRIERAADVLTRIAELKRRKNAVLLAHNYQPPEIQALADFVGDSLELSRKAAGSGAEVIVFCGVHFMAETAAILAPEKTVLLPDLAAGCPMAEMINARELRSWKSQYPGRPVVAYVNTTAEVKAESDICCTSANALRVVESLPDPEILFVPDKNLAAYVAGHSSKRVIAWDGYCWVHHRLKPSDIQDKKARHPEAEVWVHPECPPEVVAIADRVLSTGQMVAEAAKTARSEVIVGTEATMVHRLRRENPRVVFVPAKEAALCANMKVLTPEKIGRALEEGIYHIQVPPEIAARARGAIEAMIRL